MHLGLNRRRKKIFDWESCFAYSSKKNCTKSINGDGQSSLKYEICACIMYDEKIKEDAKKRIKMKKIVNCPHPPRKYIC